MRRLCHKCVRGNVGAVLAPPCPDLAERASRVRQAAPLQTRIAPEASHTVSACRIIQRVFEIRFNPIAGEWVIVAAQRMKRPVLPTDSCPFCPGVGKTPPDYDVFVYQNDYPSMTLATPGDSWIRSITADDIQTGGSETPRLHYRHLPTANSHRQAGKPAPDAQAPSASGRLESLPHTANRQAPSASGRLESLPHTANRQEPSASGRLESLPHTANRQLATANLYVNKPSFGACEIILYSPDHGANIYDLADWHIEKLVRCWQQRTRELGSIQGIRYVFVFENRGEAVGVTIHHPHGQIYAFPFVPRKIQQEIEACRQYVKKNSRCLLCDMVSEELGHGVRLVAENEHFACFIPFFARFPFEAHVISRRHLASVVDLNDAEVLAFGKILQALIRGYDRLFGFTAAYIMAFHQAPTDGGDYSAYHFHVEFYPAHADSKTRKHLSGTEIGIDVFVNPSDVEANAAQLRRAVEASEP